MRRVIPAAILFFLIGAIPLCAAGLDDRTPDQQSIDALAARAKLAQPREQCFLYAELLHEMTELSMRQYSAGEVEKASDMLKQIQDLAHKIHLSVSEDDKRLKNAEILLRHTAFRLTGLLHASSVEDQPLVAQTLALVNKVQTEAMMQVFKK
ncbi:MAG: hypothetical protein WCE75_07835 [Terracidiphilus sp.]